MLFPIDIAVNFSQSAYSVGENSGPIQPVVILSNPSPNDVTVKVFITDTNEGSASGKYGSASGKYCCVIY